uniref:Forkhead box protein fkh-2 n=2 Tax=Plectus sambesii TaxID=2011161 RepID=A0A914WDB1_9BILA
MTAQLDKSLGTFEWLTLIGHENSSQKKKSSSSVEEPMSDLSDSVESDAKPTISKADEGVGPCYAVDGKPNLSYAELIRRAIESSMVKKMTLNEIYQWITENFPYYRQQEKNQSWKNSIRHNLSLNKLFVREQRERGDPGKGSYWRIDESANDQWSRNRRTRPPSVGCCQDNNPGVSSERSPNYNAPRVNPLIQRMYGEPMRLQTQHTTDHHVTQNGLLSPVANGHLQSDALNGSHGSTCSWTSQGSIPMLKLPALDSSTDLSSSFRNLYQSVFNSSFGSSGLQASQSSGFPFSSDHQSLASTDPMSLSQSGHHLHTSQPAAVDNQQVDWLKHSLIMAGVSPADVVSTSQHHQHLRPIHVHEGPVEPQYAFPPSFPPTQTPQEMLQSVDMQQFQAMMGSMQSRDVQEWLAECKDELAMSWRDFLSRSIGVNGVAPPSSCQQQLPSVQQLRHNQQHQSSYHLAPCDTTAPLGIKLEQPTTPLDEASMNIHNAPTPAALGGSSPISHGDGEAMDTCSGDDYGAMPQHFSGEEPRVRATTISGCGPSSMGERNPVLGSVRRQSTDLITAGQQLLSTDHVVKEDDIDDDFDWEGLINKD